jgi:hypothetical protein
MSASSAAVIVYGATANDYLGLTAELADVDGDGQVDVAVGAPGADVAATDDGVAAGDSLGLALSNAGDVAGTGSDALFLGAWMNDDNGSSSGAAYVVP